MANLFENKDRRVVPNWRSFNKTSSLGELSNITIQKPTNISLDIIHDYIEDWESNKTLPHAGDLISAAFVNGIYQNESVDEAVNFIIANNKQSTYSQITLANKFTTIHNPNLSSRLENITLDDFDRLVNPQLIHERIKFIKGNILAYPYNPINYVELSRNYSILAQEKKSINAMKIALHLSPDNRFILRSAARLFAHYEDLDFAHDLLRNNQLTKHDPWLTSAEVALATLRGRSSRFIKLGNEMIDSNRFSPLSLTELGSSIGTVELINGSHKKSRMFFKKSMIQPNDNSLAQIEWASSKDKQLEININNFGTYHKFEALAIDNYHNNQLQLALENTFRWFLDMPFSKRPIMFGSHIATLLYKDSDISRAFLKAGLISHPNDPQIINNIAYSFALEDNVKEAKEAFSKIDTSSEINKTTQICLDATQGLIYFREGFYDPGRFYYRKAMEGAKEIKNHYFSWLAVLNYAREEILIKSEYMNNVIEAIKLIPDETPLNDVRKLKNEVLELYSKITSES